MKKKISWQNIVFLVVIVLLLIPQTGKPIKVMVHKVQMMIFSPSAFAKADQLHIPSFDYKLSNLDGISQEIAIGKGSVTFVSYWATWCPPCIAELPSIQKLYDDYESRVDFVLITQEDPEIVQEFLDKKGYSMPVYNPLQNTPEPLAERSIPTNYIIDQKGNIVLKKQGAADWDSASVRNLLDALIAGR